MTLARRIAAVIDLDDQNRTTSLFRRGGMDVPHIEAVARYHEDDGADEVWLRIAPDDTRGASAFFDTLKGVRPRIHVPLVVWGGVRSASDARLLVGLGADRVVIDAGHFSKKEVLDLTRDVANSVGQASVSLALVTRRHVMAPAGWSNDGGAVWDLCNVFGESRNEDAVALADELSKVGAGEIVVQPSPQVFATGVATGHDPELVERLLSSLPLQVVSVGRDKEASDLAPPLLMGADGVASATLFADGEMTVKQAKADLSEFGIALRPTFHPYAL